MLSLTVFPEKLDPTCDIEKWPCFSSLSTLSVRDRTASMRKLNNDHYKSTVPCNLSTIENTEGGKGVIESSRGVIEGGKGGGDSE